MRQVFAFALGWIFGSIALLLFLNSRGRLVPPAGPPATTSSIASAGETEPPGMTRETSRVDAIPSDLLARDEMVAIPVRGIDAADLRGSFGDARSEGRRHNAIDIRAPLGTPVLSATDGTVRKLFTSRAGGLTIYVFDKRNRYVYYYAHLARYADGLIEGKKVRQGEIIGYVGATGNAAAAGPHLHFAIEKLPRTLEWSKGSAIDPYPVLMSRGIAYD